MRRQRGVFTASVGGLALQYVRDEEGLRLLANGQRDIAFIGSDKFTEMKLNGSLADANIIDTVPIDCSMVLAGKPVEDMEIYIKLGRPMTVATSYPYMLKRALGASLNALEPIYVSGGCEGYVASGLADLLFDIKATGETLNENGLKIYQESDKLMLNVLDSCEYDPRSEGERLLDSLKVVAATLLKRFNSPDEFANSLTVELMQSQNKRIKKLFEEFGELTQAFQRPIADKDEIISEAADLIYVIQVFLALEGLSWLDVLKLDIVRNQQ